MTQSKAQYQVGIDLGTTHTVVAYAPLTDSEPHAPTLFEIKQLVAPGEVAARPYLPSFRYHPLADEFPETDVQLPWSHPALDGDIQATPIIGEWARDLSSRVEGRTVTSAKSWLSYDGVDRESSILPWGANDTEKVSPVVASASYLAHVRAAWNHEFPDALLEHQQLVITIPASFDEMARALTLDAAQRAGLSDVVLLEEPQAVCYDWYARHRDQRDALLKDARLILVCDVGGGTTDLSLIRIEQNSGGNGGLQLRRIGVGDHLMLGGDNIDLALAHLAEQQLKAPGQKPIRFNASTLGQLLQQGRLAKERLLDAGAPGSAKMTVLGAGARLIGGARSVEIAQHELRTMVLDGYFPLSPESLADFEPEARRRNAVVSMGLPYESNPSISYHLAAFLRQQAESQIPDTLLLNGGVFRSELLCDRVRDVLSQWRDGQPVRLLENDRPDSSVAFGAVAFGFARQGQGDTIKGGSARSYFLLMGEEQDQAVCVLPKGTEEEQTQCLEGRRFKLKIGEPVRFILASSTAGHAVKAGEIVKTDDHFNVLPPLIAVPDGNPGDDVDVSLEATLSSVGTLSLECVASVPDGDNPNVHAQRWQLAFELRSNEKSATQLSDLPSNFPQAITLIEEVFGDRKKEALDAKAVKQLRNRLESVLGNRDQWGLEVLRALFDTLFQHRKRRRRSAAHERVWFNLAGYALRPGFGTPADAWSVDQIWSQIYSSGLQFQNEAQNWTEWWTFWRRVAGGLTQEQQVKLLDSIAKYLNPATARQSKTAAEIKKRGYESMVKLAGSLERLPVDKKLELSAWFQKRLKKASETENSWWALGRLGARVAFHGAAQEVVPPEKVSELVSFCLKENWSKQRAPAFAAVMMTRKCGDRSRDVEQDVRDQVLKALQKAKAPASWLNLVSEVVELEEAELKQVFGERLPAGLVLVE